MTDRESSQIELTVDKLKSSSQHGKPLLKLFTILMSVLLIGWLSLNHQQDTALSTQQPWGLHFPWLMRTLTLLISLILGSYVYKLILWAIYKPVDGNVLHQSLLPKITVIIPAYNEGTMVKKSLLQVQYQWSKD